MSRLDFRTRNAFHDGAEIGRREALVGKVEVQQVGGRQPCTQKVTGKLVEQHRLAHLPRPHQDTGTAILLAEQEFQQSRVEVSTDRGDPGRYCPGVTPPRVELSRDGLNNVHCNG